MNFVHSYRGRFLQIVVSNKQWYIVTNHVTRCKTSQALQQNATSKEKMPYIPSGPKNLSCRKRQQDNGKKTKGKMSLSPPKKIEKYECSIIHYFATCIDWLPAGQSHAINVTFNSFIVVWTLLDRNLMRIICCGVRGHCLVCLCTQQVKGSEINTRIQLILQNVSIHSLNHTFDIAEIQN